MLYIIIALLILAFIYFTLSYIVAGTIIHLPRQIIPKTPKDYGLNFSPVEFKAEDGVNLKGWLIPGSTNKLIIITHVGSFSKYGHTLQSRSFANHYNKEVEFLKMAVHLRKAGYWVLMFDFRNHGESDASPNKGIVTIGLEEYKDVAAAMNFVKNNPDIKDKDVGFVSLCMGADSTIIAMSKKPEVFKDVKCLFLVQPISMDVFIRTYAKILFTPLGAKLLLPMIKKFVVLRGGYPLEQMSPREYVKDIKVPTLYAQSKIDPWTEFSDIQGFYENTKTPKEFYWMENQKHRFEGYSYFGEHPEKMLEWLGKWFE